MKIYLATWLEDDQGTAMTNVGCKNRLLSYHFLKNKGYMLHEYVSTGRKLKKGNDESK